MYELINSKPPSALIKVMGVGGGGGNAVKHMLNTDLEGVEFVCANTDVQALAQVDAQSIQLGTQLTAGLGAGTDPAVGRQAAQEDRERIKQVLQGADMVFITAGMGGGTGTGAAPIVAEIAKELGVLTVAVVTKPFVHEGKRRMRVAMDGLKELAENVDSLIVIQNENLRKVLGKDCALTVAFAAANDVLKGAVQGISDLITQPGMINVDFADVRTVMSEMGMAMMGTGIASGENRALEAAEAAINSPLLEDLDLKGANSVLVNITASEDLSLGEFTDVGSLIEEYTNENATVVVGTAINAKMGDKVKVTMVATGLGSLAPSGSKPQATKSQANSCTGAGKENQLDLDIPAVLRRNKNQALDGTASEEVIVKSENFDVPAFMRKGED